MDDLAGLGAISDPKNETASVAELRSNRLQRSVENLTAATDQQHAIDDPFHQMHLVRAEQDRHSGIPQFTQKFQEQILIEWIETGERLVEDDKSRAVQDGADELDTQVNALSDTERRDFRITHIGFVFQDFALIDYLDVLDNILHPYRITKALTLDTQVRSRAGRLATAMGLKDKLQRYPGALSQGEKQRVAICRALLPKPKLVLADEATGNLDPTNKFLILDLLFQSVAEQHATLIAVTHDHELLSRFDRVVDFRDFSRDFHAEAAA